MGWIRCQKQGPWPGLIITSQRILWNVITYRGLSICFWHQIIISYPSFVRAWPLLIIGGFCNSGKPWGGFHFRHFQSWTRATCPCVSTNYQPMMTSWRGNGYRITVPLWRHCIMVIISNDELRTTIHVSHCWARYRIELIINRGARHIRCYLLDTLLDITIT